MPTANERLNRIYESDVVGVLEVDSKLRFTRANKGFLGMLGYALPELLDRNILSITHPEDVSLMQAAHLRLIEGDDTVRYQKRYVAKDGREVPCLVGIQAGRRAANGWPSWFLAFVSPLGDVIAARDKAQQLTTKLDDVYRETAGALARAIEARDTYTAGHQDNVAALAVRIGRGMGLDAARLYGVYLSGLVHDIGKIGVPPEFLAKVTKLTSLEFDFIKQHTTFGFDILKGVKSPWPLADAAHQHHERLDGSGYPNKLMRADITLEARIIAVADTVDSMIKPRPYRSARGMELTEKALLQGRGGQLDTDVVDACLRLDIFAAAGGPERSN
ncbi:MAG: HD domain-containing protein [Rhodospirillaceae bacterium]|nr:HD domain-containing protein [Rhodospirillaceae bacterium]